MLRVNSIIQNSCPATNPSDSRIPTPQKHEIPFPPVIENPASRSVLSWHPESRLRNKADHASHQTYCGRSTMDIVWKFEISTVWKNILYCTSQTDVHETESRINKLTKNSIRSQFLRIFQFAFYADLQWLRMYFKKI